jgi:hypothetical protein
VQAVTIGGTTLVAVFAGSTWQPVRDPATLIPADTTSAVITYQLFGSTDNPDGPLTVTDPAQLAAIVAMVNAEPVSTEGPRSCPAPAARMAIDFRTATGALAAHAELGGCDTIALTVGDRYTVLTGAVEMITTVLDAIHSTWPRH